METSRGFCVRDLLKLFSPQSVPWIGLYMSAQDRSDCSEDRFCFGTFCCTSPAATHSYCALRIQSLPTLLCSMVGHAASANVPGQARQALTFEQHPCLPRVEALHLEDGMLLNVHAEDEVLDILVALNQQFATGVFILQRFALSCP